MEACMSPSALAELVNHRVALYAETARCSLAKLERLFEELGTTQELEAELSRIALAAELVWTSGVHKFEGKVESLRSRVDEALAETLALQALLEPGVQHAKHDVPPHATVREALEHALQVLGVWRQRKQEKLVEYEALQMSNNALRQQLGVSVPSTKPDLSKAGFDFLHLENERLVAEQERRMGQLHEEMGKLRQICGEVLGEDVLRVAAQVHPSLRHYSFEDASGGGGGGVDGSGGASGGGTPGGAWSSAPDLSEKTLAALEDKIKALHVTKVEREAQLQQLQDVLVSLWDAQRVPDEAPERATFTSAMSGRARLHAANIDKVVGEVRRLEENRTQSMRDLTLAKARELQAACAATHMPAPSLQDILADLGGGGPGARGKAGSGAGAGGGGGAVDGQVTPGSGGGGGGANGSTPGQISECLGRVLRALADVNREAARRQPLVQAINEVQVARVEAAWLKEYEADPNRFKGRDATSRLQRSLRAQKMRETLPGLASGVQRQLESWQLTQGAPFLYDGQDYMEQLQEVQADCANSEREKAHLRAQLTQRSSSTRQAAAPGGGAPLTPASAAKPPGGPAGARGTTTAGMMLTPATLKKGVSVQLTASTLRRVSGGSFASISTQFGAGELAAMAAGAGTGAGSNAHHQQPLSSSKTPARSPSMMQQQQGSASKATPPPPPHLPQSTPPPPLSSGQQTPVMRVTGASGGGAAAAQPAQQQQQQQVSGPYLARTPQGGGEVRATRSTASSGGAPGPSSKQSSEGGSSTATAATATGASRPAGAGKQQVDNAAAAHNNVAHVLVTPDSELVTKQQRATRQVGEAMRATTEAVVVPAAPPSAPPKVSRIPRFSFH